MKVFNPSGQPGSLDFDTAHIILTFRQHPAMAPGRYASGQDRSRASRLTGSDNSSSPRRRSVAIQDLLNPVGGDNGSGLRQTAQRNQYSGSHQGRGWSRQSSLNSGSRGSPQRRASPSSSSGRPSPPRDRERRSFRPTYSEEEVDFIWYHRVDLRWEWSDVLRAFNYQFPDKTAREVGGIQCKYYRHLESIGIPQVRRRNRSASVENYGMRAHTGHWYPWMDR